MSALVVIPVFLRSPDDLMITIRTIESVRRTEPDVEILAVDDYSPVRPLVDEFETKSEELKFDLHRKPENTGFSRTVNVGLRVALETDRDAVLMNADMEMMTRGWLDICVDQKDTDGRPASVVGGLLIYPNGLVQHAGVFFSLLTRSFDHLYRFAPALLPEANVTARCPVTGAFQFIRHEALVSVGIYDEDYQMSFEDVDYCLRVFDSGRECIYQPRIQAIHYESLFRGRADEKLSDWQSESLRTLMVKHAKTNMSRFIPEIV